MSMTINSSSMRSMSAYYQQAAKNAQAVKDEFKVAVSATAETEAVAEPEAKTLEQYKQEIAAKIGQMPIHPSQANARQSVSIHDNVFQKMMDDPEYEAEILGELETGFMANFGIAEPAFCTARWDANGEYSGTAGGSAYLGEYEKESSDAFWKREPSRKNKAQEKKDEISKFLEELYERKRQQKADMQENYLLDRIGGGAYKSFMGGGASSAASIFSNNGFMA